MNLNPIEIIKQDERGIIFYCGKSNFISRKKGTISADHRHGEREIFYLLSGEIEITVSDETRVVKAPVSIEIEPGVYHKLVALTDFEMIIDREGIKK